MKTLIKLTSILFFLTLNLTAQVVISNPDFATENDSIIITFDATKGDQGLMGYTGDVFAHTGVYTNLNSLEWQYVIESWGNDATQPKLTRIATDLYQLVIGYPRDFYGVATEEHILQLNFVFRSEGADGPTGRDVGGNDIYLPLFHSGINVSIVEPSESNLLVLINEEIDVVAKSVSSDSLFLYLDDNLLASTTSDSIGYTITVDNENDHNIIAKAYSDHEGFVYDTVSYSVRGEVVIKELPAGVIDGINYIDNSTVTLSLF
ncbi:MAG: hypothetical protein KAI45_00370, partial [Melioribacteraceae bacterium]|nr:hypothetical protein [Melioribacteraceae bacterium]